MQLANPLTQQQIDASLELWAQGWESAEIKKAREDAPHPAKDVFKKVFALRLHYGVVIKDGNLPLVAACIEDFFRQEPTATDADLVQQLMQAIYPATRQNEYVIASKYVNLFVDSSVPILDSRAELMMGYHLDTSVQSIDKRRYHRFREDIETLRKSAELTCTVSQMDPYLWIAGSYLFYWNGHDQKTRKQVNRDLQPYFERLDRDSASEPLLAIMLNK